MGSGKFADRYFRFKKSLEQCVVNLRMTYSRFVAHQLRKQVVKTKGQKVLTRKLKRRIKKYAKERFGSKGYWPYLAFYAELRGHYVDGWLPYDYFRYVLLPKVNPQSSCEISEQKTFDHKIFGDFTLEPLFVYISGMFLNSDFKQVKTEQVQEFLTAYNDTIIAKEERGTHGKQVKVMHSSEFNPDSIRSDLNYIIQPYVKQYSVLNDLYPDSVNTFRVTSYLGQEGSVKIKSCILRFGVDGSKVDNLSAGGQFIYFDEAGKPSEQAYDTLGLPAGVKHKNTGFTYADFSIPMYNKVIESCKTAHMKYPYVRVIGWDVCVDEKGDPKLLEWNADNPGIHPDDALFGPLWTDDKEILLK